MFTPAVLAQPSPPAETPPADSLRTINGVVTNIAKPGAELATAQAGTKQEICLAPGGASADCARHKVRFTANANAADALQLTTPGHEQLQFQALFLAYYDTATSTFQGAGKTGLLALRLRALASDLVAGGHDGFTSAAVPPAHPTPGSSPPPSRRRVCAPV